MAETASFTSRRLAETVVKAYIRPQTYLNVVYLLLAFPLGVFYFVFLVVGLGLGFGLLVTLVGLPILLAVHVVSWTLVTFERTMAIRLLKVDIPPMLPKESSGRGLWGKVKGHLTNPVTWTGIFFLMAKFPIGVVSFLVTVLFIALTVALVAGPAIYKISAINLGLLKVDTLGEAIVLVPVGVLVALIAPQVLNLAAFLSGRFAYLMMGARWWETPREE